MTLPNRLFYIISCSNKSESEKSSSSSEDESSPSKGTKADQIRYFYRYQPNFFVTMMHRCLVILVVYIHFKIYYCHAKETTFPKYTIYHKPTTFLQDLEKSSIRKMKEERNCGRISFKHQAAVHV